MRLSVSTEIIRPRIPLIAEATPVRFIPRVRQLVLFEIGVRNERPFAGSALEILLPVVPFEMHREAARLREPFPANGASVRPLARVRSHVHDQRTRAVESLVANGARVTLLAGVRPHVLRELVALAKRLLADAANVRAFARVRSNVRY